MGLFKSISKSVKKAVSTVSRAVSSSPLVSMMKPALAVATMVPGLSTVAGVATIASSAIGSITSTVKSSPVPSSVPSTSTVIRKVAGGLIKSAYIADTKKLKRK